MKTLRYFFAAAAILLSFAVSGQGVKDKDIRLPILWDWWMNKPGTPAPSQDTISLVKNKTIWRVGESGNTAQFVAPAGSSLVMWEIIESEDRRNNPGSYTVIESGSASAISYTFATEHKYRYYDILAWISDANNKLDTVSFRHVIACFPPIPTQYDEDWALSGDDFLSTFTDTGKGFSGLARPSSTTEDRTYSNNERGEYAIKVHGNGTDRVRFAGLRGSPTHWVHFVFEPGTTITATHSGRGFAWYLNGGNQYVLFDGGAGEDASIDYAVRMNAHPDALGGQTVYCQVGTGGTSAVTDQPNHDLIFHGIEIHGADNSPPGTNPETQIGYVVAGTFANPQSAGLTTDQVKNGDIVRVFNGSSYSFHVVLNQTQLNQSGSFTTWASSAAAFSFQTTENATFNGNEGDPGYYEFQRIYFMYSKIMYAGNEGVYEGFFNDLEDDITGFRHSKLNTFICAWNIIWKARWDGIQTANAVILEVHDNYIYQAGLANSTVHQYGYIGNHGIVDGLVYNNIIWDCSNAVFHHVGETGGSHDFFSNVVYQPRNGDFMQIENVMENVNEDEVPISVFGNTYIIPNNTGSQFWLNGDETVTPIVDTRPVVNIANNIIISKRSEASLFVLDSDFADVQAGFNLYNYVASSVTPVNFEGALDFNITSTSPVYNAKIASWSDSPLHNYDISGVARQSFSQGAYSGYKNFINVTKKTIASFTNPSNPPPYDTGTKTKQEIIDALPTQVTAALTDESSLTLNVTGWTDVDTYNSAVAGTYRFRSIVEVPYYVNSTLLYAEVTVTLNTPVFDPSDLSKCLYWFDFGSSATLPIVSKGSNTASTTTVATTGSPTYSTAAIGGHTMPHYNLARPNAQGWQVSSSITLNEHEIWIKVAIVANTNGQRFGGFTNTIDFDKVASNLINFQSASTTLTMLAADGVRWVRIVVPASPGTTATAYLYDANGALVTSNTFTIPSTRPGTISSIGIGINDNSNASPMDGAYYHYILFNANLSAGEITSMLAWTPTH